MNQFPPGSPADGVAIFKEAPLNQWFADAGHGGYFVTEDGGTAFIQPDDDRVGYFMCQVFYGDWTVVNAKMPSLDRARQWAAASLQAWAKDSLGETTAEWYGEDPDFPVRDWQAEVADLNTRLGYSDWVSHQREAYRS